MMQAQLPEGFDPVVVDFARDVARDILVAGLTEEDGKIIEVGDGARTVAQVVTLTLSILAGYLNRNGHPGGAWLATESAAAVSREILRIQFPPEGRPVH